MLNFDGTQTEDATMTTMMDARRSLARQRTPLLTRFGAAAMRPLGWLAGAMAVAWRMVEQFQDIQESRRQLLQMDDRMLHDIGLTRLDAEYEAGRPIWDGRMPFQDR
jgi:uncharacterized protein YjiS (DUF1127 family)